MTGNVQVSMRNGAEAPFLVTPIQIPVCLLRPQARDLLSQTENDEPQPQVVVAFGFLITNWAPLMSSL
jgi:hypothetical protein